MTNFGLQFLSNLHLSKKLNELRTFIIPQPEPVLCEILPVVNSCDEPWIALVIMVNWVEQVGLNLVALLAKQAGVDLNSGIITLLETFGDCVERESRNRHMHKRRIQKLHQEVELTYNNVSREVLDIRETMFNGSLNDRRYFYVERHPETYLPTVTLRLNRLPDLVVHVPRHYGIRRNGVTFGFCTSDCGGRLSGLVAQAANQLTSHCKSVQWEISITAIISFWVNTVLRVQAEQRTDTDIATVNQDEEENADIQERRGVKRSSSHNHARQRGRWKARRTLDPKSSTASTNINNLSDSRIQCHPSNNVQLLNNLSVRPADAITGLT